MSNREQLMADPCLSRVEVEPHHPTGPRHLRGGWLRVVRIRHTGRSRRRLSKSKSVREIARPPNRDAQTSKRKKTSSGV